MTENQSVFSCPLTSCGWKYTSPVTEHPNVVEFILNDHFESHEVTDFIKEIQRLKERCVDWEIAASAEAELVDEKARELREANDLLAKWNEFRRILISWCDDADREPKGSSFDGRISSASVRGLLADMEDEDE